MNTVFAFPGQGSQSVGMGAELYKNNAAARAVFDTVDDALGQKLSDIIFNGPADELNLTANAQPAIFSTSIAIWESQKDEGRSMKDENNSTSSFILYPSDFVMGHSLGEYTALCAAGAMSVADTAKLLRVRGNAMQAAAPVGMGSVAVILGLDIDVIQKICAEITSSFLLHPSSFSGVWVANDNAPGQVVISGEKTAVERAMDLARTAGAKRAMALPLTVPVHCPLMQPAVSEMSAAIMATDMRAPIVPLISNQTCAPMSDPAEIRASLIYQITHGVRWRESVLTLGKLGVERFIEIGPGSVLTGLVSRIDSELKTEKIGE
jgi:[acyl-carrier-protein] S-malonyltransferase